ncbi:Endonuclease YncB, thermonuclease family [Hymenobacter daecheongensis DSM 21074]|uniref:Endonuclease YncB, thermonuclease family n=1 Tax=Hymenobacter daecheongensis DSM 21074 TaxID=1121955 RepID=A0A1M6J459_9BACT|nr:thermonuclease family protein [Hymenobacter daecheongensis]SHJ41494.1 Endonuclease YncB, thermonuclease family [Hymenobacter daecheongensis DSM 21074]
MKDKALYISGWLLMVAAGFGLGEAAVNSLSADQPGGTAPTQEVGRMVRVVDADTYDVLAGGVTYRVRLMGVDAPEPDQPYGQQAGDSVAQLLRPKRQVLISRRGVDLYGRTLATVRLPVAGTPALALDSLLVVRGWAWAFDPKRRVAGRAAQQAAAVAGRRGLWKCGAVGVLMPRQWRKLNYKNKRRYGVGCTW